MQEDCCPDGERAWISCLGYCCNHILLLPTSLSKTYWHQLTFPLHWASAFISMAMETSVIPTLLGGCLKDSKVVYFKGSDLGRPSEISSKDKLTCLKLYLVCTEWKDITACAAEDGSPLRGCLGWDVQAGMCRTWPTWKMRPSLKNKTRGCWQGKLHLVSMPWTFSLSGFCHSPALWIQGSDNHMSHFEGVSDQTGDKAWQTPTLSHGIITTSMSHSREETSGCSCSQRCLEGVGVGSKDSSSEAASITSAARAPCHTLPCCCHTPSAILTKTCFSGGGRDPLQQLCQLPSLSTYASTSEPCSICFSSR